VSFLKAPPIERSSGSTDGTGRILDELEVETRIRPGTEGCQLCHESLDMVRDAEGPVHFAVNTVGYWRLFRTSRGAKEVGAGRNRESSVPSRPETSPSSVANGIFVRVSRSCRQLRGRTAASGGKGKPP
jgi:hypothetical protein